MSRKEKTSPGTQAAPRLNVYRAGHVAVLIIGVLALNIIASQLFFRVDVTGDRVFSLSSGTRSLLGKIGDNELTAKLFFSRSMPELPVMIKTYATRVEEVLKEYSTKSGGKLRVEVIDPTPDSDEEEWARKYGLQGVRLPSGDEMFFGVVFVRGSRESPIPYLDPRREEFLESDLSMALVDVSRSGKSEIGIMSGLDGVLTSEQPMMGQGGGQGEGWVLVNELRRLFDVQTIETSATVISPELKLLLVIHPKDLSESTEYAIDQFVLGGGRLVVMVDPMSRNDLMASQQAMMASPGQMPKISSNLPKLFAAWGVEFRADELVGDQNHQTQINVGGMGLSYPFFMSLGKESLGKDSVISGSLHQLLIGEGGAIKLKEGSTNTLETLVETSTASGVANASMIAFMPPQELVRQFKTDNQKRIIAGLLRGKFKSAFTAAPPAPAAAEGAPAPATPGPHRAEADNEGSIVIIADVDFASDQNSVDKMQFVNQVMVRPRNDNLNLVLNAVDVLSGSEDLVNIRSKGKIQRPFTKVAALQTSAQLKWQKEEEELSTKLQELQAKLNQLQEQRSDGSRFGLSVEQQREVEKFRAEEIALRKRRREVRKNLREDIEALGRRLLFANMVVVPMAVAGFGIGMFVRRARRRRTAMHDAALAQGPE